MINKEKQINHITKRYSVLENVPREERLSVFNRSKKHPLFWGAMLILFIIWFYFFGWELIQLSGNLFDANDKGLIMKFVSAFKKLLVPALIPAMVLFITVWRVQAYIIKKIDVVSGHTARFS